MSDIPNLQQLLTELNEVDDWYSLGVALGVRVGKLREIKTSNSQGGVRCWKIDMFQSWLDSTPTASWKDVIRALEQLDHVALAARLRSKYIGQQPPPGYKRACIWLMLFVTLLIPTVLLSLLMQPPAQPLSFAVFFEPPAIRPLAQPPSQPPSFAGSEAESPVGSMQNVAAALVKEFSQYYIITDHTDLVMKGVTFDIFKEETSYKFVEGIQLNHFTTIINTIAKRFEIPDKTKKTLLNFHQHTKMNIIYVMDFKFSSGKLGDFTYGCIATVKRNGDEIDLAYALYHLQYKLSPKVSEELQREKLRTLGDDNSGMCRIYIITTPSKEDHDDIQIYFIHKLIAGFRKEFVEADTCAANSDC